MSPVGLCFLFFVSVLVCHWEPVCCYANGKVTKACGSMKPHHGGASGQTILSPYQLQTNTSTFSPAPYNECLTRRSEVMDDPSVMEMWTWMDINTQQMDEDQSPTEENPQKISLNIGLGDLWWNSDATFVHEKAFHLFI